MRQLCFACIFLASVLICQSSPIKKLQRREFDLHNVVRYAYDRQGLEKQLGEATTVEVREFLQSVQKDLSDIEAISQKIIEHDWTTELQLTEEEQELLFHLWIMDSYLPNVGGGPKSLFLDDCKKEYMATDFSTEATFEDAKLAALVQILTCGYNGWRTMENVLDISDLTEDDLKSVGTMAAILEKISIGVSEMFTLGRFLEVIATIDGSEYTDPESFNKALKSDAIEKMDKKPDGGKKDEGMYVDDKDDTAKQDGDGQSMRPKPTAGPKTDGDSKTMRPKPTGQSNDQKSSNDESSSKAVSLVSRINRIRDLKAKLLLSRILKALNDRRK
ncbi:uncharacterized protein LOC127698307 isoform X2 [Mytilus californianus]|uniref:uncharacterized protein LOC127698307 isoform X2 n=1 Tax=Mytilus californianus TaxID=6549 RepID=UPI002247D85C|nr:uncharacterized protein LOC127698307 isoform X2 [Mytilus californianus]